MFETSILTTHTINLLVISIYAITTCASFVAFSTLCLGSIRHLASNSTSQSLTN